MKTMIVLQRVDRVYFRTQCSTHRHVIAQNARMGGKVKNAIVLQWKRTVIFRESKIMIEKLRWKIEMENLVLHFKSFI